MRCCKLASWSCSSDRAAATAACAPVAAAALPSHRDAHGRHQGGLEHPGGRCYKAVTRNSTPCGRLAMTRYGLSVCGSAMSFIVHRSTLAMR